MNKDEIKKIEGLINNPCNEDGVIKFVKKSNNLEVAIERAFASKDENGKMAEHQWRVGKTVLNNAHNRFRLLSNLNNCNNFEDIYNLIDQVKEKRFGILAKYDVALRISFYFKEKLNKDYLPDRVHLTAHPAIAYRYITEKTAPRFVERSQIHPLITNSNLEPWRIEWLLCEFAKHIKH